MSLERLQEHRRLWKEKAVLPRIYKVWFDALLGEIGPRQRVLEIGAGPGLLSAYAREADPARLWIATDILETPWNSLVVDGGRLPLKSASIDAVAAFDLVHHLADPRGFFEEASRVLAPGGRIVVVEPWVTPFSYPIYRFLHEEGCRLSLDPWDPFGVAQGGSKAAFTGDAAVVSRLVRTTGSATWESLGLGPPKVHLLNGFAYLLSGGFQPYSLLPGSLVDLFQGVDRWTLSLSPLLALRVLATWDRSPRSAGAA
jgi:SAM-dependent methyltransferase